MPDSRSVRLLLIADLRRGRLPARRSAALRRGASRNGLTLGSVPKTVRQRTRQALQPGGHMILRLLFRGTDGARLAAGLSPLGANDADTDPVEQRVRLRPARAESGAAGVPAARRVREAYPPDSCPGKRPDLAMP